MSVSSLAHVCVRAFLGVRVDVCCICFFSAVVFGSVDLFQLSASLSVLTRSKSLSDIPMVYPVCKVPNGRMVNDVRGENGVASDWNHGKPQCTTVAEDAEAQWQDVSAKGRRTPVSLKSTAAHPRCLKSSL